MATTPTRAAVGKPVTVRLKNGHIWHGVLDPATDAARYAIQRAGRVDVIRRHEVETLIVREPRTL